MRTVTKMLLVTAATAMAIPAFAAPKTQSGSFGDLT
jgi:hypothetical protein